MTHMGQAIELALSAASWRVAPRSTGPAIRSSRLYLQAGIKLGISHSGRRSLAARVFGATGDGETVQTNLGFQYLDHSLT